MMSKARVGGVVGGVVVCGGYYILYVVVLNL
jgi:hypothetical protein